MSSLPSLSLVQMAGRVARKPPEEAARGSRTGPGDVTPVLQRVVLDGATGARGREMVAENHPVILILDSSE